LSTWGRGGIKRNEEERGVEAERTGRKQWKWRRGVGLGLRWGVMRRVG